MHISSACIKIIKEFEGLELNAYLDPVGIPTIGWGTIRYPNGKKVSLGDQVSEAEAEAFLKYECDQVAEDVDAILANPVVTVGQNQFDALVCFIYNVGVGAFLESTMLRMLRANDFPRAAAEFGRWVKGTVNGAKVTLPGLVTRRQKEQALFEKQGAGEAPEFLEKSDVERVVLLKGFRRGSRNIIVGYDSDAAVLEIVELGDSLPATIAACVATYPNAQIFEFARTGQALPVGETKTFTGKERPLLKPAKKPKLVRSLLRRGSTDEGQNNDDVRNMQMRLTDLGYFKGTINGIFDADTDAAAKDFQTQYFGLAEADGKVGPKTWDKLWGDSKVADPGVGATAGAGNYLLLTKTSAKDAQGCTVLKLAYFRNGTFAEGIEVCSGVPSKQNFRTGPNSKSLSLEPLPEGLWGLQNIEWKDGKDNYAGNIWNGGLGPAKIRLDYRGPGKTDRSAIEIHIDWNRPGAWGTAGCVGVQNVTDFKRLVTWLRETDPEKLYVDWGLGTCPTPYVG
jgi:lysozyme